MKYLKALFLSVLLVFFANYLTPGIEVMHQTKIPHFGGDLIFSGGLGFLNSLIGPFLRLIGSKTSVFRVSIIALILNFGVYALLKLIPVGIFVTTAEGYIIVSLVVSIGSILINCLCGKKREKAPKTEHTHIHSHSEHENNADF